MRALLSAVIILQVLSPPAPGPEAFSFFRPTVTLTNDDREALARGLPIVNFLPATGRELGAFTAIEVDRTVTLGRAAAWMRRVELLRENSYVIATGRFSTPPRLSDLDRLTLSDADVDDIRRCSPGRCGVKLSAAEIRELQAAITQAGADWRLEVQRAFRTIVLRRVQRFIGGGHPALDDTCDHRRPVPPAEAFARLVEHTKFLSAHTPELTRWLLSCPAAPTAAAETFFYWSKEGMGGKAVISVTSVVLVSGTGVERPPLMLVGAQVFATHYFDASLHVTALVHDASTSKMYLVYVQRSDIDLLSGFWGPFARSVIEGRVRRDGPAIVRRVSARLAGGEPPEGSERHAWPSR